jgi:molecular chaperone HtpG
LSTGEHGDVAVYVRRMMVEERCRELLPPWARFVTGVVESAALQPTASRESVRRDWAFKTLQEAIGKRILAYLRETASEEPAQFRKIVGTHNALIKAWALEFPEIFPVVADLVVFDTGLGPLTLPEVHARVQEADTRGMLRVSWKARPLYYTDDRQAAAQARLLLESRGVPVIDASHGWEHMFLERYAELQQDVELVAIRAGDRSVFAEPPPAEKAKWDRLVEACDQLGIRAIAASFEPRILPALLVLDEEEQQVIAARRLTERMDVIGQLREVVEQIAGRLEEGYSRRGILYLNTLHPLIQKLAARDPEDPDVLRVLSLLYGHAALLEQRSLTRDAALRLFSESADALRHFLRV